MLALKDGEEQPRIIWVNEVEDTMEGFVRSRLRLVPSELGIRKTASILLCARGGSFVIDPRSRFWSCWQHVIFFWSIFSTFLTPLEFCFFRGLPDHIVSLESAQLIFLVDVVLHFFVAYRDLHSHNMVYDRNSIAIRYGKGSFLVDLLGCVPWDAIYKASGRREAMRYMIWIRLYRARKVSQFFKRTEKDVRINYLFTRIVKLITVELYCTHTAACLFYYLATTLPPAEEGYTWIGNLTMGDYKYINFREIDFWTRYITSLYFAVVTMATVGYGDIHAVNLREMIFIMIFVSFDMILGAYLIGNMTALIVKGSKTERFRDKMTDLIKYMNRNKLDKDIRSQIKDHLTHEYDNSYTEASVLDDIPVALRSEISENLYIKTVQKVPLFKGCSNEFLKQIVMKLNEEFFLPGEVILEQSSAVDQVYIVSSGRLEEVGFGENGSEKLIANLEPGNIFGEVAVLCNIPQPYTVRVCELCRLLRIEKQSLNGILQLYFRDSRLVLNNLLKGKDTDLRINQLESDIAYLITKQYSELALRVNSAAYHGDLYHLKDLINAGVDLCKTDYDGRCALHLAAAKGYEEIVRFLIQHGANPNCIDNLGNSPLFEAVKAGNDKTALLLIKHGAKLHLEDAGRYLCKAVMGSNIDLLKSLLENGVDPNSRNYDLRTPLHFAAAEGLHLVANILIKFGADVLSKDRYGRTPLDEGRTCGSKPLIRILEQTKEAWLARPTVFERA